MKIKEIRVRKLENGYQFEHVQDNGTAVATGEITGFAAIRSVIGAIERWEEEKKDKIEQEYQIAHQITQTLQTLVEGEYATKEEIRKIMQEEIVKKGNEK